MAHPDDLDLLYASRNPADIMEFYNHFESREDLIEWMSRRPHGNATIYETEGDTDIIVVIPTADYSGPYAKSCREEIFKGLHIIFVQSGGRDDVYFNIARNVNIGLRKALEYSPRWIVYSNDDMYRIDNVMKLEYELYRINEEKVKAVFTDPPGKYHSYRIRLSEPTPLRNLAYSLYGKGHRDKLEIDRKFGVKILADTSGAFSKVFYRKKREVLLTSDFAIFSSDYVRETMGRLWDETYINGVEDIDQSLIVTENEDEYDFINYRIGDYVGSVLGNSLDRELRDRANFVYLNHKIDNGLIKF